MATRYPHPINDTMETLMAPPSTHRQTDDVTDPNEPSKNWMQETEDEGTGRVEEYFEDVSQYHALGDQNSSMLTTSQIEHDDGLVNALADQGDIQRQETPDLFERTFTNVQQTNTLDESGGEGSSSTLKKNNDRQIATDTFDASEHNEGCNGCSASTPPTTFQIIKQSTSKQLSDPNVQPPIDPIKDLCANYRFHQRFHNRVKALKPNLVHPPHRYWIGVVPVGKKIHNVKDEKHLTWMRGNRKTTVRTVQESYMLATMTPDVVILFWKERVDVHTRMEELDDFNDKLIVLRAMDMHDPESRGQVIGEGWEPKPYPKETSRSKGAEISNTAVIEIDSD